MRRRFVKRLETDGPPIAEGALRQITGPYAIEASVRGRAPKIRLAARKELSAPIVAAFRPWLEAQLSRIPKASKLAGDIRYTLGLWQGLTRFLEGGCLELNTTPVENQIRPIALGRSNWLFAGSLRAGQRAAAIMSLIQSARLNGHEPFAYLKDVLERLPSQPYSRIGELLPHRWQPAVSV